MFRDELYGQGYLKRAKNDKAKKIKPLAPLEYVSDDGYTILSSQLVTYDLDNALTQVVTGPDVIAEDVTATDGLIIFSIADKGIRSVTFTR